MSFRKAIFICKREALAPLAAEGAIPIIIEDLTPATLNKMKELREDHRVDKVWSTEGLIRYTLASDKEKVRKFPGAFTPVNEVIKWFVPSQAFHLSILFSKAPSVQFCWQLLWPTACLSAKPVLIFHQPHTLTCMVFQILLFYLRCNVLTNVFIFHLKILHVFFFPNNNFFGTWPFYIMFLIFIFTYITFWLIYLLNDVLIIIIIYLF